MPLKLERDLLKFSALDLSNSCHLSSSVHHQTTATMSDRADSPSNEKEHREDEDEVKQSPPPADHDSDSDSELSEADENLFADEDIDAEIREVNEAAQRVFMEDAVKSLGRHKRTIVDRTRKPGAASRSRARGRKRGRNVEEEEEAEGVTIEDDQRQRKTRVRSRTPDEDLPEEEREYDVPILWIIADPPKASNASWTERSMRHSSLERARGARRGTMKTSTASTTS